MAYTIVKQQFIQNPKISSGAGLSPTAKLTLEQLYDVLKDKEVTNHTNETLAKGAETSVRTTCRNLNELETKGFIERQCWGKARKITLGMRFKLSASTYTKTVTKSILVKKIVPKRAKVTAQQCHDGIHTKSPLLRDKYGLNHEDHKMIQWYKSRPNLDVPTRYKEFINLI